MWSAITLTHSESATIAGGADVGVEAQIVVQGAAALAVDGGGAERGGRTQSVWLNSGDVVVLEGDGRLAYHGIDRIRFGSSALLEGGGRINLTLRVVR